MLLLCQKNRLCIKLIKLSGEKKKTAILCPVPSSFVGGQDKCEWCDGGRKWHHVTRPHHPVVGEVKPRHRCWSIQYFGRCHSLLQVWVALTCTAALRTHARRRHRITASSGWACWRVAFIILRTWHHGDHPPRMTDVLTAELKVFN